MNADTIQIVHAGGTLVLAGRAAVFCMVLASRARWVNDALYGALEFHINNGRDTVHQIEKDRIVPFMEPAGVTRLAAPRR